MNSSETVSRFERSLPASWPAYWWANAVCALATILTTTVFGAALVSCFRSGRPLDVDLVWSGYGHLLHGDPTVWNGLEFSVPLLVILLAHELGHYLQCRRWLVDATLPFFLPSPFLFGTFGAFIRIKSPILTRASLFDIGIAGPLAGFAVLLPFLIAGVGLSQVLPAGVPAQFAFGSPLAIQWLEKLFFPPFSPERILLHPMAMGAWVGLLATAMNLLPLGQLDGGHIVYAAFGPRIHRIVATVLVVILAVMGFYYRPWWIWSAIALFRGRRHPLVYDREPLPHNRWALAALTCLVFLLSFSLIPVNVG